MNKPRPIPFAWKLVDDTDDHGEVRRTLAMVPLPHFHNIAVNQFGGDGSVHVLIPHVERNMRFHNWYFAALHEQYSNIREEFTARWDDETHFREWLLVNRTKWFTENEYDLDAERTIKGSTDSYTWVHIRGNKVIVRKPRSQSVRAMGKDDFDQSANDVLEAATEFTGISAGQAKKEAGKHA